MRIAVFSLGPLFPEHVHGGSQKTLEAIVRHLAEEGHHVSVYCTRRDDNQHSFELHSRATVSPVLGFKQTYPEPYYAAPYLLAGVVETLGNAIESHDRFYVHDGELLYQFLYQDIPTVLSFQDFVYPDTLAGALSFRRDHLVLSSEYVRTCVDQVFRRFRRLPADRITVASNGFDLHVLKPVNSSSLRKQLGLSPDIIPILYPHRPDPRKGIVESLNIVLTALDQLPQEEAKRVRLLVPIWVDSNVAQSTEHVYQGLYSQVREMVDLTGWPDLLHLHPWIPVSQMAEYYSLGRVSLCVGSFIEAFGNVSVESQLCGTPAIVSRVGAQRQVLPDDLVTKIDYGDDKTAADALLAAIRGEALYDLEAFRDFVAARYSHSAMVSGYAAAILDAERLPDLPAFVPTPLHQGTLEIPAWCASLASGYYCDYEYGYIDEPRLLDVVARAQRGRVQRHLVHDVASDADVERWIKSGFLCGR